jgi:secreted Zn-dependent insulinase-like peptidase
VQAVESEFQQARLNDFSRAEQLWATRCDLTDPASRFLWGNAKSIREDPPTRGHDARENVVEFFRRHYVPRNMSLVLRSALPLRTQAALVSKYFSFDVDLTDQAPVTVTKAPQAPSVPRTARVPFSRLAETVWDQSSTACSESEGGDARSVTEAPRAASTIAPTAPRSLISEEQVMVSSELSGGGSPVGPLWRSPLSFPFRSVIHRWRPVTDLLRVRVHWVLPGVLRLWKAWPDTIVTHCVGHEGAGSVVSYLRSKGWSSGLTAGIGSSGMDNNSCFSKFEVSIILTEAGAEHWPEVVEALFSYLELLRAAGPEERMWKETSMVQRLAFDYADEQDCREHTVTLACAMSDAALAVPQTVSEAWQALYAQALSRIRDSAPSSPFRDLPDPIDAVMDDGMVPPEQLLPYGDIMLLPFRHALPRLLAFAEALQPKTAQLELISRAFIRPESQLATVVGPCSDPAIAAASVDTSTRAPDTLHGDAVIADDDTSWSPPVPFRPVSQHGSALSSPRPARFDDAFDEETLSLIKRGHRRVKSLPSVLLDEQDSDDDSDDSDEGDVDEIRSRYSRRSSKRPHRVIHRRQHSFRTHTLGEAALRALAPLHLNHVEPWFGTSYRADDTPQEMLERWEAPASLSELALPPDNPFLPERLGVEPFEADPSSWEAAYAPVDHEQLYGLGASSMLAWQAARKAASLGTAQAVLLDSSNTMRLWWLQYRKFLIPRSFVRVLVYPASMLPQACRDTSLPFGQIGEATLWAEICADKIKERAYLADSAEVSSEIKYLRDQKAVQIELSGFSDKLPVVLAEACGGLASLAEAIHPPRFDRVKEICLRRARNMFHRPIALSHAARLRALLDSPESEKEALISSLAAATIESVRAFAEATINGGCFVEILAVGNETHRSSRAIANTVASFLTHDTSPKSLMASPMDPQSLLDPRKVPNHRVTLLPTGDPVTIRLVPRDEEDPNTVALLYVQCDVPRTAESIAKLTLLQSLLAEPMFDQLRNTEQLGYVVSCDSRNTCNIVGLTFLVQSSEHSADFLLGRIRAFIDEWIQNKLPDMEPTQFAHHRHSQVLLFQEQPTTLEELVDVCWAPISLRSYAFDEDLAIADAVGEITQDEMVCFAKKLLEPETWRSLVILVDKRYHELGEIESVAKQLQHRSDVRFLDELETFTGTWATVELTDGASLGSPATAEALD